MNLYKGENQFELIQRNLGEKDNNDSWVTHSVKPSRSTKLRLNTGEKFLPVEFDDFIWCNSVWKPLVIEFHCQ
jgi:hypothetical protein